jgi:WD40 repeat protein
MPLDVYNRHASNSAPIKIESQLVQAVLTHVRAGELTLGESTGTGRTKDQSHRKQIETAFLQLVMTRLWEEEAREGSRVLRTSTFNRLGGARQIVQTHLDTVMAELTLGEREGSARMFRFLVTPKGAKIAHETSDLADFAARPLKEVKSLLDKLNAMRVLRRISPPERYEIFHDVLAPAILDWRSRFVQEQQRQELEEQAASERRVARVFRQLALALAVMVLLAAVVTGYAWWLKRRADASERRAVQERFVAITARDAAQRETRIALAHQLAGASLNSRGNSALLFALGSIFVTRTEDGLVVPDAADALRRASPALPVFLSRPGHMGKIERVGYSPDGTRIVTASDEDHMVKVWDAMSGEELFSFAQQRCGQPLFSRDGQKLACVGFGGADVFNLNLGKIVAHVDAAVERHVHGRALERFFFSPDGTLIATGAFTLPNMQQTAYKTFPGRGASFSPDGRRLATIVDKTVKVWETSTGDQKGSIDFTEQITNVVFYQDGAKLAIAAATSVSLWDVVSNRELLSFHATNEPNVASVIGFSTDGRQLFTAGGRVATALGGSEITTETIDSWDSSSGRGLRSRSVRLLGDDVHLDGGGKWVIAQRTRPLSPVSLMLNLDDASKSVTSFDGPVAVSPDGQRMVTAEGQSAVIQDPVSRNNRVTLPARDEMLNFAAIDPPRLRAATSGGDGFVRIWNLVKGTRLLEFPEPTVNRLAFSPDGKWLVTVQAGSPQAHLRDAASGRLLHTLAGHRAQIMGVAFSPNGGRIATASHDFTAKLWDSNSGREIVPSHPIAAESTIFSLAFSGDGKRLATVASDGVTVWEVASGSKVTTQALSVNAPWRALQSLSDHFDWTSFSGTSPNDLSSTPPVFSHDFKYFAEIIDERAVGDRQAVRLSSMPSAKEQTSLFGQTAAVKAIALSPDERHLYAVSSNWTVYRHPLLFDDLIGEARSRVNGSLTEDDCQVYLHQECPAGLEAWTAVRSQQTRRSVR